MNYNFKDTILRLTALALSAALLSSPARAQEEEAGFPIRVNPGHLSLMASSGDSALSQELEIQAASGMDWSVTSAQPWLMVWPQAGRGAGRVTVTIPMEMLSSGSHSGTLTVTRPGWPGSAAVNVSVQVGSNAPPPVAAPTPAPSQPAPPPVAAPLPVPPAGPPAAVSGNQFYVSPSGSASGDGSAGRPWDLQTALNHPGAVRPGDTIWLRGGAYRGEFNSQLNGRAGAAVVLRQYPGERATINGSLAVRGSYTWFWGFEVMRNPRKDGADCIGTYENSHGTKLINLIVHDCGSNGIGYWGRTGDSEIHGTLIYYNGFQTAARGAGHGIYLQNDNVTGGKTISDNIIFKGYNLGIQAYGSENSHLKNVRIEGNIVFEPGTAQRGGNRVDGILVTVGSGAEDIVVQGNYLYNKPTADDGYSRLGWQWSGREKNIVARDNYFIGGESGIELWNWNNAHFTNNTIYTMYGRMMTLAHRGDQPLHHYSVGGNTYFGSGKFQYNGRNASLGEMQARGLEHGSRHAGASPTGVWVFARPNKYEPGRGHVVVYNWDMTSHASVDLSRIVRPGASYEVRDAQNYFGPPVAGGVYHGGAVAIPLTSTAVASPSGSLPTPPSHTGPQFNAFVVISR